MSVIKVIKTSVSIIKFTMKKIVIVSILSIIFVNAINAQKITELQALEKARDFMKDKTFSNKEMSMTRALTVVVAVRVSASV